MKITKEQIEAALAYADRCRDMQIYINIQILAAAYRAKCLECEELRDYIYGETSNLP